MDKKPLIFGAIAVVVVLVIVFLGRRGGEAPTGPEGSPGSTTTADGASALSGGQAGAQPTATPKTGTLPTAKNVSFTSPVANAQWGIGEYHTVAWSRGFGVTAGAELLNASTKAVVGSINPSIKEFQQSFTWDGRYVFLSRTSPQQKLAAPGVYVFRVTFDKNAGAVESPSFALVEKTPGGALLQTMTIKDASVTPTKVTAKRGEKVSLVNDDGVSYELHLSSFLVQTVPAGGSWTIDTTLLDRTSYALTAVGYSALKGTIVVE